ncbi:MAG TPA: phosphomannomutase, partial [Candidatus Marinimicrobia bacterium]|nr:phosphomannomutase [Candidatus Neomarinimicrobiota bacterium]
MKINPYIFRQYDVRGIVEEDFPSEFVSGFGKAFGTLVKRSGVREVALSGDVRLSTPQLKKLFKEGVLNTGVDIIDIGTLPTPANYYSMWKLDAGAAVQITGSHNPSNMNGFKMSLKKGAVYGDQIQQLKGFMERDDFESGEGTEVRYKILDEYIEMIQSKITFDHQMTLAMDSGNAAACLAAP